MSGDVTVRRFSGSAAEFHQRPITAPDGVELWAFTVERPAIVLGSRQRPDLVDVEACRQEGVEIATRRSGGGVVLLEPGAVEWIDVVVPPGSPWWTDDVVDMLVRCGRAWHAALSTLGVAAGARVHTGRLQRDPLSDLICFAGLGAGEVTTADGAKLVGLSQRRTRDGARLQGAVHRRWNPPRLHRLLAPGGPDLPQVESIAVATIDTPPGALLEALTAAAANASGA